MSTLSRDLRKALERVSADARRVAEGGAEKALNALAVAERDAHRSMTNTQAALRNRLRAHGRQLGDRRHAEKGTQETDHLIAECAYEHWHRMLFARFLAENQLLLEPDSGAAIAIDEVKELARALAQDWVALAGEFAVRMLPQVFRRDDPVLEVQFAPEDRRRLEALLESLPEAVFLAMDSLGWCYQFWQAERKDEINASGDKIGADELAAVTQLFTEDYMVDFLLDNTLGAWHAGKVLAANPQLAEHAKNEEELREVVALRGCPWKYLRFIRGNGGKWVPAAGTFGGWPERAKELRCLDPCMGSGHFVAAMFERMVALRLAEDKHDEVAAVAAVIRDNVFGLEIDPRCTQIGAFNVALAAWRRVGHCTLPSMNIACSGLAPNTSELDWLAMAGDNQKLRNGMERLYRLFKSAPVLGSLINPRAAEGDLLVAAFHDLQPLLEKALAKEREDDAAHEMAVTARGLTKAAEILAGRFTLVATNVPYLGRGKQHEILQDYCERFHSQAKADLATCFAERCLDLCVSGGSAAMVTPQTWFFQAAYRQYRVRTLRERTWNVVARLGEGGFESSAAAGAFVAMLVLTNQTPREEHSFTGIDVAEKRTPSEKASELFTKTPVLLLQRDLIGNPDHKVTLVSHSSSVRLASYCSSVLGLGTGDYAHYGRTFWEFPRLSDEWAPQQSTVDDPTLYGGRRYVVAWDSNENRVRGMSLAEREQIHNQDQSGQQAWNRSGVAIGLMRELKPTLYTGEKFEKMLAVLLPNDPSIIPALWSYVSSPEFCKCVRELDSGVVVASATLAKVPFDLTHWQEVAAEKYPHGLPKPSSSDLSQWLFNGHPRGSDQPLHVAVTRLLGYRWPRQTGSSFYDSPAFGQDGLETRTAEVGIVCLSATKGEAPAGERLRELLACAYGKDWNVEMLERLLTHVGYGGKTLDDWLRGGFFEQHCALFQQRPFAWSIWDGLSDGFQALVNYHNLAASNGEGRRTLERLAFSYLGDWIARQRAEQKAGREGADGKLVAALHLQEQLKRILGGEPPYDLFIRWKPLYDQALGWEPDMNDGVRLNIRPFMLAETLNGRSIFRKAPKITWKKDRGKEPERPKRDFPWFWSWDQETDDFRGARDFDGNRWNDVHYSHEMKREARAGHEEKRR